MLYEDENDTIDDTIETHSVFSEETFIEEIPVTVIDNSINR